MWWNGADPGHDESIEIRTSQRGRPRRRAGNDSAHSRIAASKFGCFSAQLSPTLRSLGEVLPCRRGPWDPPMSVDLVLWESVTDALTLGRIIKEIILTVLLSHCSISLSLSISSRPDTKFPFGLLRISYNCLAFWIENLSVPLSIASTTGRRHRTLCSLTLLLSKKTRPRFPIIDVG